MTEPSKHQVAVTVNGVPYRTEVAARRLLSDFLRHDIGLTGTHVGCEHGVCGACTVLVDGLPIRSCLAFAVTINGRSVTTIEGLAASDGTLHPVQQAFRDHHGLQCGFCTPGFVLSACGYLADRLGFMDRDHDASAAEPPSRRAVEQTEDVGHDEVREAMSGNLCRCTGYAGILAAVQASAAQFATSGVDPRARHTTVSDDADLQGQTVVSDDDGANSGAPS